jgi:hypothetical protein
MIKRCASRHVIEIFGRQIDPLQRIYLQTKTIQKNERICPFEPTSPVFELSKTGNTIIPVAVVIGLTSSSSCHIHQDFLTSVCPLELHRYANFFSQLLTPIYVFSISPVFIYFYKFSISSRSIFYYYFIFSTQSV